jgi:hypothetical protein
MEMLPALANVLAGKFDPKTRASYEQHMAEAIIAANKTLKPARIAIGAAKLAGSRSDRTATRRPVDRRVV